MTLFDYIELSKEWEITVFDKNYDVELYFFKNEEYEEKDTREKSMEELSKILTVESISKQGVTVDLSEVIKNKINELNKTDLFDFTIDIDVLMEDVESILSGNVSEDWIKEFVDVLS